MTYLRPFRLLGSAAILTAGLFLTTNQAHAQVVLDDLHADIGIFYGPPENAPGDPPDWDLHVHDHEADAEYAPDEAYLAVNDSTLDTRPASASFAFIGVGAGASYYHLPQSQVIGQLFLGLGAEEIPSGTFASYTESDPRVSGSNEWIRMSLVSVSGPGVFSVWRSEVGGPVPFISSADGIGPDDVLFAASGSHSHFNYGFSAPGVYDITFQASAQDVNSPGTTLTSAPATYRFLVGNTAIAAAASAPEPGALGLILIPALGWVGRRYRRNTLHKF